MSLSDTKQAHMYATVAEVAAAQCKAYTEEARKAPEYTEEARQYAEQAQTASTSAEEASQQAASSVNESSQNASSAQIYADSAAQYATQAQNIADANTFYITSSDPDGTLAGIENTPDGKIFRVAQGASSLNSFIYYLNNNGSAVVVAENPGAQALREVNETIRQESLSPYLAVTDAFGRIGGGFSAYKERNRFGAAGNTVSDDGLVTKSATLNADGIDTQKLSLTTYSGPTLITDLLGRAKPLSSTSQSPQYNDGIQVLEPASYDLWVLGGQNFNIGRVNKRELQVQVSAIVREKSLGLVPLSGSLVAPFADSAVYTVSMAFQVPQLTDASERVMLYSFTSSSTSAGVRCWIETDSGGNISINALRYDANSPRVGEFIPSWARPGDWIFFSHVVSLGNTGDNFQTIFIGGGKYKKCREFDVVVKTNSSRNIGIGNAYYSGSDWQKTTLNVGEFTLFTSSLNSIQMNEHFNRSKVRMSVRGINLKSGA